MFKDLVLYRKYRPFQLEDIVGQRHVVATLKQASINKRFAHAYLFSGNHGSGKTSMARILANLMECENAVDGKLCGKCRACSTIHQGVASDVIEIDGASNSGVENVKNVIDAAQWSPQELNRKIYIIDEVHRLTNAAASALLKTLEEPPSYLSFILCTTEIDKILTTSLSRCQKFNFSKIPSKDIVARLSIIAKQENINIENDALFLIAKMARGSMRDAIGYLEQVGTLAGEKLITASNAQKYFGLADRQGILNIANAILDSNISLILDQINDLIMASVQPKEIIDEISEVFRNAMVIKAQNGDTKLVDLPDNETQEIKKIGSGLTMAQLLKLARLFASIEVDKKQTFNINDRWIMEATIINCVELLRSK